MWYYIGFGVINKKHLKNIFIKNILHLKNLKSLCGKRDAFDCAGIRSRVVRLPVDCSTAISLFFHREI